MLDDDQVATSLSKDGHRLEGEATSEFQFSESTMQSAENARVVACNKENLLTLQVQVAIEHGYEMLSRGYQDVKWSFLEG